MAKQIFIQFTSDGAIVQQESSASNIRQGDANGEVTIVAAFAGMSNADYVARAHFERPDGKRANVVMIPSQQTTNRFEYVVQSAWFFAVAGTAKVTVTITDSGGAVSAQGLYAFEIAATTVDVIDSTLTYDEAAALEGLIAQQSEALQSAVAKLMNGETVVGKALRDADGNIISQTYAQDSRVVHLEGNERVYGTKEFVGTIKANSLIPHAGNSAIGDSEDGRWQIGYFKYVDLGYLKAGNLIFTLPNAGGVLVTEAGAQSIANTAKEQAIAFANTYTDNQKNALQAEIDAINATQNVVDIVGTKANLLAYDTTNLQSGDKIEVLVDESQNGANTIYSFENSAWALIGSKAPYYSVAQIDALLAYYVTAIDLSTTLEDYATKAYLADAINENCITLDKGGYVNLAEDPASANTVYFGAHHGTKSSVALSDHRFTYKVSDDSTAIVHDANRSGGGLVMWTVIDATTSPSTLKQTKLPFRAGSHFLAFQDDLDTANAKIAKNESDIQYLYRQVIGGGDLVTQTDSRVALTSQPFPLTVSPKALLDYVGGMCQKVNQLVVNGTFEDASGWSSGDVSKGTIAVSNNELTYTVIEPGASYSNGFRRFNIPSVQGHKCLVVFEAKSSSSSITLGFDITNTWSSDIGQTTTSYKKYAAILTCGNSTDFYICTRGGASAGDTITFRNVTFTDITDAYPTDTPTSTSDARIQWLMSYLSSHPEYDAGSIITAPVTMVISKDTNGDVVKEYPIPAEVRALEGYGYGLSADCYNEVSFEGKSYGKRVARVDLGSLNWTFLSDSTFNCFNAQVAGKANGIYNLLCGRYSNAIVVGTTSDKVISGNVNGNYIYVRDTSFNGDATAFKQAMSGVYLYYELATPVETDISGYIDGDVIEVSAGGHLEFENEDDLGVPYSATYQCEPNP